MIEKKDSKTIIIDAKNQSLGRIASAIAYYLQDKHKPSYAPNKTGETVVIVKNLKEIFFKGSKLETKKYFKHTGYLGHLKEETLKALWQKNPEKVLRMAVRGMLPKNKLRDRRLKRLKIE
ncbi:MAG: 50S ribosomal protein L13 [Minisyncoccia bacterium]